MASIDEHVDRALRAVREFADAAVGFTMSELEARLADFPPPGQRRVDPHHLTTARRMLGEAGELDSRIDRTWGGHEVEIYFSTEAAPSKVEIVASRKRAATSHFLGWALGDQRHPSGLIGPAAETATHRAIERSAAVAGYRLAPQGRAGVEELLGTAVPGGPLDNAAHFAAMDGSSPVGVVTMLVEVKNIRDWIYPNSWELYQLLDKAARLQLEHPSQLLLPVLVCRRAHVTAHKMAKNLGFYIIQTRVNFLRPSADVDRDAVDTVREVLGFADLLVQEDPNDHMLRQFSNILPAQAIIKARQWQTSAPVVADVVHTLRNPAIPPYERSGIVDYLRQLAYEIPFDGQPGGW